MPRVKSKPRIIMHTDKLSVRIYPTDAYGRYIVEAVLTAGAPGALYSLLALLPPPPNSCGTTLAQTHTHAPNRRTRAIAIRRHLQPQLEKIKRSRSLTDIHSSGALAPSPLRNCALYDEEGLPVHVGQVYESLPESMHMSGANHMRYQAPQRSYPVSATGYVPTPTTARQNSLHTPPTVTTRNAYMSTPSSSYNGTPINMTPATAVMATPATSIMITPASAISPVSPVNARFRLPMTHGQNAFGEGTGAGVRVPESEERRAMKGWKVEGSWGQGGSGMLGIETEEEDARTEIGSPEMAMGEGDLYAAHMSDLRLPPARSSLPSAPVYPPSGAAAQQTRRAMRAGAVSQDVLLYGPAGVTPAPAELVRNNACDKLPPIPNVIPPRQATFYGIQNIPLADGSGRFATLGAPGMRPIPSRPVYPPAGIAPLIAGYQGLPHGGLTAPIERGDEMLQWKETQHTKERADVWNNPAGSSDNLSNRTASISPSPSLIDSTPLTDSSYCSPLHTVWDTPKAPSMGHRGYPAAHVGEWEYDMTSSPGREHSQLEIPANYFAHRPTPQQQVASSQASALSANPNAQDSVGRYPSTTPHKAALQHSSFGSNASGYSTGLPAVPFESIQTGDTKAELSGGMRSLAVDDSGTRPAHNSNAVAHGRAVSYAGGLGVLDVQASGMPMPAPMPSAGAA
ncbi:hypothetical protein BDV93DRAFT_566847, partial [Ceratobasidium sp. AG-I]